MSTILNIDCQMKFFLDIFKQGRCPAQNVRYFNLWAVPHYRSALL